MAYDKVIDSTQLDADLKVVADAIRSKSGTTEEMAFPSEFKSVVESIDTSKEEQEKTVDITENGTTEVIPDIGKVFSKVIVNVAIQSGSSSGSSNMLPEPKLLCTVTAEDDLKNIIANTPIPRKYKNSLVILKHVGDNIATGGSETVNTMLINICEDDWDDSVLIASYLNGRVAPNTMSFVATAFGKNSTYVGINEEGAISTIGYTGAHIAVGNSLYYLELPFNYNTFEMDTTERG